MRHATATMKSVESTEDWIKRIGSAKAMEARQSERLAGKLNAPIRGPRSLALIVARMAGTPTTVGHPWSCECELCRPWLWDESGKISTDRDQPAPHEAEPVKPTVIATAPEPKKKASKWQSRRRSGN